MNIKYYTSQCKYCTTLEGEWESRYRSLWQKKHQEQYNGLEEIQKQYQEDVFTPEKLTSSSYMMIRIN